MGAAPACFVLALSLPRADNNWLERLCEGIFGLARRYDVQLVGGDTVRGPLAVTITAHGWVPAGQALLRSGARAGDRIFVTGELGDAGIALRQEQGSLALSQGDSAVVTERLTRPMPRVEAGVALRGIASSAIDVSDGLIGDLGHILEQSGVGAQVELGRLPVSHVYRSLLPQLGWDVALANGDDYELCFTVPESNMGNLKAATAALGYPVTHIGDIVAGEGLRLSDAAGKPYRPQSAAHDHFRSPIETIENRHD
jgi:thiamine-monophosphate kinase